MSPLYFGSLSNLLRTKVSHDPPSPPLKKISLESKPKPVDVVPTKILALAKDELWEYHPDNPKRKNVVQEYAKLCVEIEALEGTLATLHQ